MKNSWFQFKQFKIHQDKTAMKVTTDGCLFGAWVADHLKNEKDDKAILDIGTGTGLLALIVAQQNPSFIEAVELDPNAFVQAKENVSASPFVSRINLIQGDVREIKFDKKYDIIFSNPPFYENELKSSSTTRNIAHHGESLRMEELMTIIKKNLKPGGSFFLLLPYKRDNEIPELFNNNELQLVEKVLVRQSTTHDFFRIMLMGMHGNEGIKSYSEYELAIRDEDGSYTAKFIQLLKDYYLNM